MSVTSIPAANTCANDNETITVSLKEWQRICQENARLSSLSWEYEMKLAGARKWMTKLLTTAGQQADMITHLAAQIEELQRAVKKGYRYDA